MNNIDNKYIITIDQLNNSEAVVSVTAPTKVEIQAVLRVMKQRLTYVDDSKKFTWEVREGFGDANEYFFDIHTQTLAIGLLSRLRFELNKFAPQFKIVITDNIRKIFTIPSGVEVTNQDISNFADSLDLKNIVNNERIVPYEHQINLVTKAINKRRASLLACTSAGKSLSINILTRWLIKNERGKILVIVPSTNLVEQLFSDFSNDYGWVDAKKYCTLIHGTSEDKLTNKQKSKLSDLGLGEEVMLKDITISTWQSLQGKITACCDECSELSKKAKTMRDKKYGKCPKCEVNNEKNREFFRTFTHVIVDEAHGTRGSVLRDILKLCENAINFKIGVSGTLPDEGIENVQIESELGKKIEVIRLAELINKGILTPVSVISLIIPYNFDRRPFICRQTYQDEYSMICYNGSRKEVLKMLINSNKINQDQNTVLLYKNKDTLHEMYEYLSQEFPDFKYKLIIGDVKTHEREEIRKSLEFSSGNIILATYGTMKQGVNIKFLHNLVFCEFSKSMFEVVQAVGRTVRKHPKKKEAFIYDISDDASYFTNPRSAYGKSKLQENYSVQHYNARKIYYKQEQIPVTEYSLKGIYEADVYPELVKERREAKKKKGNKKVVSKAKGLESEFLN